MVQIVSKFDVGNTKIFPIKQQRKNITTPACEVCKGENFGIIEVDVPKYGKTKIKCPVKRTNNNHSPIVVGVNTNWVVLAPQTIILLLISWEESLVVDHAPFQRNGVTYALTPNSRMSYTAWPESNLFSSLIDAQNMCDARNKQRALECDASTGESVK